jgi:Tfp pilus assembly protein PilO
MSLTRRVFRERRAVMLPLAIFLAANVIVLLAVVWPLKRTVDGAADANYAAATALAAARQAEAEAKAQRQGKERADVELREFYGAILPRDIRGASDVTNFSLNLLARENNLTFRAGQWDHEPVGRDSNLTKLVGQFTLIGDYKNIRSFLYGVETATEFVIIESVQLAAANTAQGGAQLELSLSVATYFLSTAELEGGAR